MPTLETALRLFVIGQEFLIAAVFIFSSGQRAARFSGALLTLSIAGYLYTSDSTLGTSIPWVTAIALLLAIIVPYCLWLFARAIFEVPWPKPLVIYAVAFAVFCVWGIYLAGDTLDSIWMSRANIVMHVLALLVVAHAMWLAITGRPDDLMERRRTLRLFFVVVVAIQVTAVLIVELQLGRATPPTWLELANIIIIAALTIGLALPMLRLSSEFFEIQASMPSAAELIENPTIGSADSVLRKKLLDKMAAGYYRESGLTIRMLASELGYPEHQLRRLVNGHLGYRNFSTFLNNYRVEEARKRLADPEMARLPVLTIAFDLGYASIGPFNRAFKANTGMTPTDFRQQVSRQSSADFE